MSELTLTSLPIVGAKFSEDRKYRYVLWRRLASDQVPMIAYIGLNPSTASEDVNDNTIKKLIKITRNNGYGGFYMLNLFGIISSNPQVLVYHPDPIGANDAYLQTVIHFVDKVVLCWGTFKEAYSTGRAQAVLDMVPEEKRYCLRKTKKGLPWHPLYCLDKEEIIKF